LPALSPADIDRAASYANQGKAPTTRAAYRSDYLASEAEFGLRPSTTSRRCAAIRYAHKLAGHEPPTNSEAVKAALRGIKRSVSTAPAHKTPVLAETARA
jgi:hypothetical protein